MELKTEQEKFWASQEWGSEYIKRNSYDRVKNNISFFSKVLDRTYGINSVLEFGSNIGLNLLALNQLLPDANFSAIEINKEACESLKKTKVLRYYS